MPKEKHEVFVLMLTGQATQREAAGKWQSTVPRAADLPDREAACQYSKTQWLVAAEIARGRRSVPSGCWGVEVITGCGHRMACSGLTADDVATEAARRSWAKCEECGRELVFHTGVSGSVIFLEA